MTALIRATRLQSNGAVSVSCAPRSAPLSHGWWPDPTPGPPGADDSRPKGQCGDLAGEPTEVDRQDGTRLLTGYDADGNVQSQTDGLSHATSYGYDALNRKTSMTDALSRATSYGYDAAGNLTRSARWCRWSAG